MNELSSINDFDLSFHPDEDSYETPLDMFERLEKQYNMNFQLDAAAKENNSKCNDSFLHNAMFQPWKNPHSLTQCDVWCNPPHSMNEEFIRRADAEHKRLNINIVMIVPANVVGTKAWHELIENEIDTFTENHPVKGRPVFRKHGRKTEFPSRNSYVIIVWRKIIN